MKYDNKAIEVGAVPNVVSHSRVAKIFHWGFVGVFFYGVFKQVDEVEELEDFSLLQEEVLFASVFLLLLIARFIYMRSTRATVLPSTTSRKMKLLARSVHIAMYVCLAMIAISGLTIGGLYWSGIKEGALMDTILILHEAFFWVSVNLILLHIAGALYHRKKRDGVWNAMVPVWKE